MLVTFTNSLSHTLHYIYKDIKMEDKQNIGDCNLIENYLNENNQEPINTIKYDILLSNCKQTLRKRDKIYDKFAYIINEEKNSIDLFCIETHRNNKKFEIDEYILDFTINEKSLIVVTLNAIYIYKK
ncbi:hypothetical protein COBT_003675 [Conglomerata obtusa]